MSAVSSVSSAILYWYSALTVYSSSLTECSSSFVLCSSSFDAISSSLVACSSSLLVSISSIVACRFSFAKRSSPSRFEPARSSDRRDPNHRGRRHGDVLRGHLRLERDGPGIVAAAAALDRPDHDADLPGTRRGRDADAVQPHARPSRCARRIAADSTARSSPSIRSSRFSDGRPSFGIKNSLRRVERVNQVQLAVDQQRRRPVFLQQQVARRARRPRILGGRRATGPRPLEGRGRGPAARRAGARRASLRKSSSAVDHAELVSERGRLAGAQHQDAVRLQGEVKRRQRLALHVGDR